jgi:hypothetical protein
MGSAGGYGSAAASGNMNMQSRIPLSEGKWWEAFGTGGFEGEPGLMEGKSLFHAVLLNETGLYVLIALHLVRDWREPFTYLGEIPHCPQPFTKSRRTHHG